MMRIMMEDQYLNLAGVVFPVVFFDGERQSDLGTVVVTPAMTFHSFRSIISQKIGISYHQLTIYFERTRTTTPFYHYPNPNHHHRRHPVTSKFNFGAAMAEHSSAFFRVVLKRSRRLRRRRHRDNATAAALRHRPDDRGLMMERDKERYLMSLNLNSDVYSDLSLYGVNNGGRRGFGIASDDGASSSGGACDLCFNYAGVDSETVPFHWCKNDAVAGPYFRSRAGPIGPPRKRQMRSTLEI